MQIIHSHFLMLHQRWHASFELPIFASGRNCNCHYTCDTQRPWCFVQDLRRDKICGWWWYWSTLCSLWLIGTNSTIKHSLWLLQLQAVEVGSQRRQANMDELQCCEARYWMCTAQVTATQTYNAVRWTLSTMRHITYHSKWASMPHYWNT